MVELLLTMLERLGIIVMIAFVLTRLSFFRDMIYRDHLNNDQRFKAILFFSFFGIIGTYSGVAFHSASGTYNVWAFDLANEEAIANSRVIGVVMAGLFGGWKVGLATGFLAGAHRYTLGGFTDFACGAASVIAGLIAACFYQSKKEITLKTAFAAGALSECVQMGMILLLAKPFDRALFLVQQIGLPMIIANGLGAALFLLIIKSVVKEEEKAAALQAQKTLRMASKTIPHLRNGLDAESASVICEIVLKEVQANAVSINQQNEVLAFKGTGTPQPHLSVHKSPYIETSIGSDTILAAPIHQGEKQVGTLLFYFRTGQKISELAVESVLGISSLIGHQLQNAEIERTYTLAKEAEVKALQAQISPHFLFNSLNTIVSLTRIEPDQARRLLIDLARFLRKNLSATTAEWTSLSEELDHVRAYLSIEQTRFENRLSVHYEIDESVLHAPVPPLTLQPIVENAVKYSMQGVGDHEVHIQIQPQNGCVVVAISDDGPGVEAARQKELGQKAVSSQKGSGIGLVNVNRRLKLLVGEEAGLTFSSSQKGGLLVSFNIPIKEGDHA